MTGRVSPPRIVRVLLQSVPPDFVIMPLRIHQNTTIQAKNSFFWGRCPQTCPLVGGVLPSPHPIPRPQPNLVDLPLCLTEFQPDCVYTPRSIGTETARRLVSNRNCRRLRHTQWVSGSWVNEAGWVTWVMGQYV